MAARKWRAARRQQGWAPPQYRRAAQSGGRPAEKRAGTSSIDKAAQPSPQARWAPQCSSLCRRCWAAVHQRGTTGQAGQPLTDGRRAANRHVSDGGPCCLRPINLQPLRLQGQLALLQQLRARGRRQGGSLQLALAGGARWRRLAAAVPAGWPAHPAAASHVKHCGAAVNRASRAAGEHLQAGPPAAVLEADGLQRARHVDAAHSCRDRSLQRGLESAGAACRAQHACCAPHPTKREVGRCAAVPRVPPASPRLARIHSTPPRAPPAFAVF